MSGSPESNRVVRGSGDGVSVREAIWAAPASASLDDADIAAICSTLRLDPKWAVGELHRTVSLGEHVETEEFVGSLACEIGDRFAPPDFGSEADGNSEAIAEIAEIIERHVTAMHPRITGRDRA